MFSTKDPIDSLANKARRFKRLRTKTGCLSMAREAGAACGLPGSQAAPDPGSPHESTLLQSSRRVGGFVRNPRRVGRLATNEPPVRDARVPSALGDYQWRSSRARGAARPRARLRSRVAIPEPPRCAVTTAIVAALAKLGGCPRGPEVLRDLVPACRVEWRSPSRHALCANGAHRGSSCEVEWPAPRPRGAARPRAP